MRTVIQVASVLSVVVAAAIFAPNADARKYRQVVNGREVIVHTNPIPVLLHRAVPPHHGRHVTVKELQTGRLPRPTSGILPFAK